ncbi:astacin-like metalloprotease toxin 5, partial [Dinothrombium tinctorium]
MDSAKKALKYKPLENPNYLFGDIKIAPKKTLFSPRNAVPDDDPLWPYEPYRELIVDAMDHFHENTCVRFVERTDEDDYLHLISDEGPPVFKLKRFQLPILLNLRWNQEKYVIPTKTDDEEPELENKPGPKI